MKRIVTLFLILRFLLLPITSSANDETASASGSATDDYIPEDGKAFNDNYIYNTFICVNYCELHSCRHSKIFSQSRTFPTKQVGKDPILYYIIASKL